MKILILYTYNKGLLSEFYQELSEKLYEEGYEVVNFYLKHKKEFFIQKGVSIYGDKRSGIFKNYYHIYKIIKKVSPDVVVSNFSYINPATIFSRLLGVKRNIAWFHTAYEHTQPSKFKVLNKTFYLGLADIVIANSKFLQQEMHQIYKVPIDRTRCIPFWTNIKNYRTDSNSLTIDKKPSIFKIGCPGRLLEDKNHKVVIEAIYHLKKDYEKDIQLYIAGDGPDKDKLDELIEALELQNQVTFLGVLNVTEMVQFYDQMDVVVLPSLNEAFGLVFIEAIALGRPIIVSSQFGALNFIDDHKFSLNSFTFNPTSVNELKEKLMPYILNEGIPGDYFETLYKSTFDKQIIYQEIKNILIQEKT